MAQVLAGKFDIPEDMAKELSELLSRKTIKEDLMINVLKNKDFDQMEALEIQLIPVVQKIEAIKNNITANHVPEEFRSDRFVWNYDGYDIDGCSISVYENK